ncbi:BnaCnng59030D [Brassica napus]|uniref:BnaCnng59030D protein n=1 Tax=Brassica napus TaxID=3708 RepID=A0A078JS25_BRANA|nr:BnaCnng59030D [Brassica napus]
MGDSDDDDYVDIGRPDLVGLLPDEIDELFSTIQPEHLELIVKDSDFEKAVGTTQIRRSREVAENKKLMDFGSV